MSETTDLPACGIYRTTVAIGDVPAGRLVSFHNHGDPGPGIYLPEGWSNNLCRFGKRGMTLKDLAVVTTLAPLHAEGLYVVTHGFTCCEKNCRTFTPQTFVQLGYNAAADPILFSPTFGPTGVHLPPSGVKVDGGNLAHLERLLVEAPVSSPSTAVH